MRTPEPADRVGTGTLDPVPLCAALADDSRWRILQLIGERERSASALAEVLPISRQAIARHVAVLESVGLVRAERDGRQVRYRAIGAPLSQLAGHLQAIGRGWERRLDRLRTLAEERADAPTG